MGERDGRKRWEKEVGGRTKKVWEAVENKSSCFECKLMKRV